MGKENCQNYRVCRAIAGKKLYGLYKYCKCEACQTRLKMKRMPPNWASATTTEFSKIDEVGAYLESWTCGTDNWLRSPVILKF